MYPSVAGAQLLNITRAEKKSKRMRRVSASAYMQKKNPNSEYTRKPAEIQSK